MIVAADHGHVLCEARIFPQILGNEGSALPVQLAAGGMGEKRTHLPLLHKGHGADLVRKFFPALTAVRAEAAVHGKGDEKDLAKLIPELRGDKKTPLAVKRVLIFARHLCWPSSSGENAPFPSTFNHFALLL